MKKRKNNKEKKQNKKLITIFLMLMILSLLCFAYYVYISYYNIDLGIKKVNINYNNEIYNINIKLKTKILDFTKKYCYLSDNENENINEIKWKKASNNTCNYKNKDLSKKYLYIKDSNENISEAININEISDNKIIDITFPYEQIYLLQNEELDVTYEEKTLNNKKLKDKVKLSIEDNSIVEITNTNKLIGKTLGSTYIIAKSNNVTKKIKVTVSDLYTKTEINDKKEFIKCNQYTEEEAEELDNILKFKIEKAGGYGTRGAVVAAARFLILEAKFKLNYFPENGRLNNFNSPYVDGEGRYYHRGLYLSESKFKDIKSSSTGPVIWGCPLKIALGEIDQPVGSYYANGIDCSGFVTWCIYNGGFDVGDMGAGFNNISAVSNLAQRYNITYDLLKSGKVKAGDVIGRDGHVAIILGIDEKNVYVGESLFYNTGTVALTFSYDKLVKTNYFTYIMPMDDIYKEEGIYENMW